MARVGDIGRRGLTPKAQVVVDGLGYAIAALLAGIAASRGGKAVHPHGVVHEARLLLDGPRGAPLGSELFDTPAEHMAIMRFSRSLGLPRPVPDLLGVSLRVSDAYGSDRHQDVLMVSSIEPTRGDRAARQVDADLALRRIVRQRCPAVGEALPAPALEHAEDHQQHDRHER